MAKQADVQYVQYRVDGTAARKIQHASQEDTVTAVYQRRKAEHKVIAVDPVALAGIVLAVVVLVAMSVGLIQYRCDLQRSRQMSAYVQQLEQQNIQLEQTYHNGYDPEEILAIAQEAGMVPAQTQQRVRVQVQLPQQQEQTQMSFWDALTTFLTGIFA